MNNSEILFTLSCLMLIILIDILIIVAVFCRKYERFCQFGGCVLGMLLAYNLCEDKLLGSIILAVMTVGIVFIAFFGSVQIRKPNNVVVASIALLALCLSPVYLILQQGREDAGHRISRIIDAKSAVFGEGDNSATLHVLFMENGDVLQKVSRFSELPVQTALIEYYYNFPTGTLILNEIFLE